MSTDPEVPEADALEQAQPAGPEPEAELEPGPKQTVRAVAFEVPEADALEQSREVPLDDDR